MPALFNSVVLVASYLAVAALISGIADATMAQPRDRKFFHPSPNRGGARSPRSPAAEKINASYFGRVLRLTLLAPEIVEAVLDRRQPAEVTLAVLMRPLAGAWTEDINRLLTTFGGSP